jgi:hypothetical protein
VHLNYVPSILSIFDFIHGMLRYLVCVQSISNIYLTILYAYWIENISIIFGMVHIKYVMFIKIQLNYSSKVILI